MNRLFSIALVNLIFGLTFLNSCVSKLEKEQQLRAQCEAKRPSWAKQTPLNNDGYYWGVGEVSIPNAAPLSNATKERVRQIAWSDIANAISANVSSQSILATAKVSDQLKQTFQKTIKISSKLKLEGVELVDSYRDKFAYFELYRLSQADYAQQHARTIQAALNQSSQWLDAAEIARTKGDFRSALVFALKTLNILSDYWDENLQIVRQGKNVNPIVESDRMIHEIVSQTTIRPLISPIEITPGLEFNASKVGFRVFANSVGELRDLPIKWRSEGVKLARQSSVTDPQGAVVVPLYLTNNASQNRAIYASIDMRTILSGTILNESIEQYALRIPLPEAKLEVVQQSPLIRIVSTTKGAPSTYVKELFVQELEQKGVKLSSSNSGALLEIATKSTATNQKTYTTVTLEVAIQWNGVVQSSLTSTHSADNQEEALVLCYQTIRNEIKGRVVGTILYSMYER